MLATSLDVTLVMSFLVIVLSCGTCAVTWCVMRRQNQRLEHQKQQLDSECAVYRKELEVCRGDRDEMEAHLRTEIERWRSNGDTVSKTLNAEIAQLRYGTCTHQYVLVATALCSENVTFEETANLLSSNDCGDVILADTHYVSLRLDSNGDEDEDGESYILTYAKICKRCSHVRPVNCFEVALTQVAKWRRHFGPAGVGIFYECEETTPLSRLDSALCD